MRARLDVTTDGWCTFDTVRIGSDIDALRTAVRLIKEASDIAIAIPELDAMLSCECGSNEYGGCEYCDQHKGDHHD